jgi:hypothetical protein
VKTHRHTHTRAHTHRREEKRREREIVAEKTTTQTDCLATHVTASPLSTPLTHAHAHAQLRGLLPHQAPQDHTRGAGRREQGAVGGARGARLMMDVTVVCDAPTGCVFGLARRKAPEHYWRAASYWRLIVSEDRGRKVESRAPLAARGCWGATDPPPATGHEPYNLYL